MRVKLGFKDLSIPNQIERARQILKKMQGNLHFPSPVPSLLFFTNRINALELAYNRASHGDKKLIAIRNLRLKEMLTTVRELAAYVQMESHGDKEIILSSGFGVIEQGSPLQVSKVLKLRTREGIYAGSIHAIWKKVAGAVAYMIEICPYGTTSDRFILHRTVRPSRFILRGLEPGGVYWVRITAVDRNGNCGLPSDPSVSPASFG